ncbi:hypothetical protein CXF72_13655 [Psychromonas sp. MB-3u-54]|nr:hypothetical protein CXF72_13655 [Psychromonas sp. MB-3u-54]
MHRKHWQLVLKRTLRTTIEGSATQSKYKSAYTIELSNRFLLKGMMKLGHEHIKHILKVF